MVDVNYENSLSWLEENLMSLLINVRQSYLMHTWGSGPIGKLQKQWDAKQEEHLYFYLSKQGLST